MASTRTQRMVWSASCSSGKTSTHLASSSVMSIEGARRHNAGASRTTTRIGVGLKPLQGLFT
jgi:hypothetical protein